METPIGDDEDSHLGDFIEDSTIVSPIESSTNIGLMETVRDVLAGLTPREAKVLRMACAPGNPASGPIAQWSEQGTHNPLVPGSSPGGPTNQASDEVQRVPEIGADRDADERWRHVEGSRDDQVRLRQRPDRECSGHEVQFPRPERPQLSSIEVNLFAGSIILTYFGFFAGIASVAIFLLDQLVGIRAK